MTERAWWAAMTGRGLWGQSGWAELQKLNNISLGINKIHRLCQHTDPPSGARWVADPPARPPMPPCPLHWKHMTTRTVRTRPSLHSTHRAETGRCTRPTCHLVSIAPRGADRIHKCHVMFLHRATRARASELPDVAPRRSDRDRTVRNQTKRTNTAESPQARPKKGKTRNQVAAEAE